MTQFNSHTRNAIHESSLVDIFYAAYAMFRRALSADEPPDPQINLSFGFVEKYQGSHSLRNIRATIR